jgi:hypothetical protein
LYWFSTDLAFFSQADSLPYIFIFPAQNFHVTYFLLFRIGLLTFCLQTSASSAASDLAISQTSGPEHHSSSGWNNINKHRHKQSMSTMGSTQLNGGASIGSPSEASSVGNNRPANVRHSIDGMNGMKPFPETTAAASDVPATSIVSPSTAHLSSPPKLHQSYSANDVPTVKPNGATGLGVNANHHAQQHFHNHNASIGRIPAGAMPGRHNRELSSDASSANGRETANYPSITSTLQASAPPFGPPSGQPQQQSSSAANPALTSPAPNMPYPFYPAGPGYNPMSGPPPAGYNALPMLMQNMAVSNGNPSGMYSHQNFTGYNPLYNQPPAPRQHQDSQARVIQSRRQMDSEGKQARTPCFAILEVLTTS